MVLGLVMALVFGPSAPLAAAGGGTPRPARVASTTPAPVLDPSADGLDVLDLPLTASRLRRPMNTLAFSMAGVTWSGEIPAATGIRLRVRSHGRWSRWRTPELLTDGPNRGSAEGEGRGATDLLWVGSADGIEIDVRGSTPPDLALTLMRADDSPLSQAAARASVRDSPATRQAPDRLAKKKKKAKPTAAPRPRLRGRRAWGADPRLRERPARINRTIQQVHIHHTASSNKYTRAQVPGLLRGIYRYHTVNLGWSDIGYNFLVDRFGRTWVGRAGGAARPVRGAHTLGFNHNSTGVAVLGNYEVLRPSRRVKTALVHLAAWKLDKYGRHPRRRVVVYSQGSDRQPAGTRARLPTIDGHRDTNDTACPGKKLYAKLRGIRKRTGDRVRRF